MPPHVQQLITKLVSWVLGAIALYVTLQPKVCAYFAWSCAKNPPDLAEVATTAATVFGGLLVLFDRYIWHWGVARMGPINWTVPDIRGTWKGTLTPVDVPAGVPQPQPPRTVYLVVRQSAFRVRLTLYTAESFSRSTAAEFTRIDDESELVYSYQNVPDLNLQGHSPAHLGTAALELVSTQPVTLKGVYYTQRLTRGMLVFDKHCVQVAQSFADAQSMQCMQRPVRR